MTSSQIQPGKAIVTGGTGAIGEAIATGLAEMNYSVTLISRDQTKANNAIERIIQTTGNQKIFAKSVDLSRQDEIFALASNWNTPLNVLINNAAIAPQLRTENAAGIEMQLATNVLGYVWMSQAFKEILKSSNRGRIVNVASYWAGGLDLNDLEFKKRPYHNHDAYRQSKQANRMLTPVIAELFATDGITVNSCHPGDVNSRLSNDLGFGGSQSAERGAATPIWLASSDQVSQISGKYFEHKKEVYCPFAANTKDSKRLYDLCNGYAQARDN